MAVCRVTLGGVSQESFSTSPDTLKALAEDIRGIRLDLAGRVQGVDERLLKVEVTLLQLDATVGHPERRMPGDFPGDPEKVVPATGMCATLSRVALDNERANKERTRKSMITSGAAATITATVATIVVELLRAWNHSAEAEPAHRDPPALVAPAPPTPAAPGASR